MTSSDYTRGSVDLWIEEPTTITTASIAFMAFFDFGFTIPNFYARIGTGSFVQYVSQGNTRCASDLFMIRNDSAFTLARGKNTLTVDMYRTGTLREYIPMGACGFFIVNYTSGKASGGVSTHNRSVLWLLGDTSGTTYTAGYGAFREIAAVSPEIPETDYFLTNISGNVVHITDSSGDLQAIWLLAENLSSETGHNWEPLFAHGNNSSPETGPRFFFGCNSIFKRYPTDPIKTEMDLETDRRWLLIFRQSGGNEKALSTVMLCFTYHTITSTVAGTVTGYTGDGSGIVVEIFDTATGNKIGSATTITGGDYTFTWYDDVNEVFAVAEQAAGYVGRSDNGTAT